MFSGVYIGKSNTGSYDLVSTGDYINAVTATFKLQDSRTSKVQDIDLYLIIYDTDIDFIKVEVTGAATAIRQFVSWTGTQWGSSITLNESINAIGTTVIRNFKLRILVDDFLEYFNIAQESSHKQYKLKLVYS